MYYDEIVEADTHQISYLKNADRSYFNCAHAVNVNDDNIVNEVEKYFEQRQVNSAFYIDPEAPKELEQNLFRRGYFEDSAERENWYRLDGCNKSVFQDLSVKIELFNTQNPLLECVLFYPGTKTYLLKNFLEIDAKVNSISDHAIKNLEENLIKPKNSEIQFVCALAIENNIPVSTVLIGFYGEFAFLAEGATHPDFRQRGIYTWLNRNSIYFIAKRGVKSIVVNCDCEAYSNNTYKRLGFDYICQRHLFVKK
jgi:ribosomal protein S18 acetylase RimI-like enzyme